MTLIFRLIFFDLRISYESPNQHIDCLPKYKAKKA